MPEEAIALDPNWVKRGRVVDSPGDNLLAEFGSVVDPVQCGVAVQNELKARNADLSENLRMQFRIGINLGDVLEEGKADLQRRGSHRGPDGGTGRDWRDLYLRHNP